jgi:PhoPQ-activated pathogenicity-related protein
MTSRQQTNVLKYKHIVMAGLSGGGWTTTIAAAIDPRIQLSIPIAGSIPQAPSLLYPHTITDMPEGAYKGFTPDFEQNAVSHLIPAADPELRH